MKYKTMYLNEGREKRQKEREIVSLKNELMEAREKIIELKSIINSFELIESHLTGENDWLKKTIRLITVPARNMSEFGKALIDESSNNFIKPVI